MKGNGIHWYKFPLEPETRARSIIAAHREHWEPTQNTWIGSKHFISSEKSTDPLSPDYVPSVFQHVSSAQKQKLEESLSRYERRKAAKRKRSENATQRVEPLCEANARTSSNIPSQVIAPASISTGHGKKASGGISGRFRRFSRFPWKPPLKMIM